MKRILLFLLVCLSFKTVYSQNFEEEMDSLNIDLSSLVDKTHAERAIILTPYYEWGIRKLDSTYILSKLNSIRALANEKNDSDLKLEAELLSFHYFVYRPYFAKELIIDKLERLDKLAKKEKALWLEIRVQNMLGNYYFVNLMEYEKGFEHYQRSVYLLKDLTSKEFPLKTECLYVVGKAHYHFHDYEKAIIQFKDALKAHFKRKNNYYYIQCLNNIGMGYMYLNKIDSSDLYFNKLHTYAIDNEIKIWEGISAGNIGYNYYLKGENDKAINLIEQNVAIGKEFKEWSTVASALIGLATIKIETNSIVEAKKLLKEASYYTSISGNYSLKAKLFPLLAKIAAYDNQPQLTTLYLDSAIAVSDSLAILSNGLMLMRAKQKVQLEQQKTEVMLEKDRQNKRIWIKNIIIAGLILFTLFVLLILRQIFLSAKHREQINTSKREETLNELERFKTSIVRKNELIDRFKENLSHVNEQLENNKKDTKRVFDQEVQNEIIEQLQESTLLTNTEWEEFVKIFEKVHPNFFRTLKERWPKLTPSEIRFLALTKLKIKYKEMALMLGVGTDAIRQVKSRVRKKLELPTDTNLEDLLEKL